MTAPVLSDGLASYTPSGEVRGGVKTTYHSALKNSDIQTSSTQAVTASKVYDAFGNQLSATGTWYSPFAYAGKFGYQQDSDTGLKLLGHRYYDSSTGRFLTRDPIKDGRNWYGYCGASPIFFADPTGLWRAIACGVLGGVLGFLLTGGNPLGAAAGAAIGATLGSAADQAVEDGTVNWGHATVDGLISGAGSYFGGVFLGKLLKWLIPMQVADDGTVTFIHYTSKEAAKAIKATKVINPSGPGFGTKGGYVYGLPKPVPGYAKAFGAKTEEAIVIQVPKQFVSQNGFGHLIHQGPIRLP